MTERKRQDATLTLTSCYFQFQKKTAVLRLCKCVFNLVNNGSYLTTYSDVPGV